MSVGCGPDTPHGRKRRRDPAYAFTYDDALLATR
jgi:hypothetical protein